jgi:SAM-dependent methyltransferase
MSTPTPDYLQRGNAAFESQMALRTAADHAAYLLPHLRSGMRVLDVGCGPGSITVGLADAVAPGEVLGIDLQADQIAVARERANEAGVGNVRFEVADLSTGLELPHAYFDAAFAHAVLMHLHDPISALAEILRVLRPGGLIVVRDPDFGATIRFPLSPAATDWSSVAARVRNQRGVDGTIGRRHRQLLLRAGFERPIAQARVESFGSSEALPDLAAFLKAQAASVGAVAVENQWADEATVEAVMADLDAWAARPDAFALNVWCEAIAWVSEG